MVSGLCAPLFDTATHFSRATLLCVRSGEFAKCHAEEAARWTSSHHDQVMQKATDATALEDFDCASFEQFGVVSHIYRKDSIVLTSRSAMNCKWGDQQVDRFGVIASFPLAPIAKK